jgi:uncharacterized YccA/Bax inhibitor family protein
MTFENTMHKVVESFVTVLAFAALGAFFPILAFPGMIVGLVLGLVNAFRKEPNVALIRAYSVAQGLFVGGITAILERSMPGIALQAVLATLIVIGTVLALYRSGKVRSTPKMTRFFMIAATAYLIFALVNLALQLTGAIDGMFGMYSAEIFGIPLGLIIGPFAILLGTYSLILDFEFVQRGIANRIPERYGWTAAFGIVVTVIWIYVEILRLIAIIRN